MTMRFGRRIYLADILVGLLLWLLALPLLAQTGITLTTGERPPFIGANLEQGGYVAELVSAVFAGAGYRVQWQYSTWANAPVMARQKDAEGLICAAGSDHPDFVHSQAIVAGSVVLLKKRSTVLSYLAPEAADPALLFKSLARYRFGAVRAGVSLPAFDNADYLRKELVLSDLQNLDMLQQDRVQFTLIDRSAAADLLVSQRPHLIGELEVMPPALAPADFCLAFNKRKKNYDALLAIFNAGLAQLQRDGSAEKIMNKHGLFLPRKSKPGVVSLTIGTVNNADMLVMQDLAKSFTQAHPAIELNWRVMDEVTLRRRLQSDFAINDGQYDVMTIGTYELPIWVKQGWLAPIKNLPKTYALDDLLPTVRAHLSIQGQLYALPFYAESVMTYYRKDLFAKAGVSMPAQPSYNDIGALAAKVHDPAHGVYGICLRGKPGWGENMALLSMLVHAHGGRWFDEHWQPDLQAVPWQSSVTMYVDLLRKYGPPTPDKNGFNENLALFSKGHCGIWIDATVAAGMLFDAGRSMVSTQLGYAPAPNTGTGASRWLWSWALAIPQSSSHKSEAQQFISWATSQNYIQAVADRGGWISVPPGTRASTYANAHYQKAAPFAQFVLNAIENADRKDESNALKPYLPLQYVSIPEFRAIGDQVGIEMAKVLRQEQSVTTALKLSQHFAIDQMRSREPLK